MDLDLLCPTMALEDRCFVTVLSTCQLVRPGEGLYMRQMHSASSCDIDPEKIITGGGSVIIHPRRCSQVHQLEGVLTAELDLDNCVREKFVLDVVDHYARPDRSLGAISIPNIFCLQVYI
jgi:hypothetical protein